MRNLHSIEKNNMKSVLPILFMVLSQCLSAQDFSDFCLHPPFDGVRFSTIDYADVDGDEDQDILITGLLAGVRSAQLYLNDGQGKYSLDNNTPFEGVIRGAAGFSDVDNDGDQDVLIAGFDIGRPKLYLNDGEGNFSLTSNNTFIRGTDNSLAFVDVDGDNDEDLLLTGRDDFNDPIAILYKNNGNGNFTEVENTPFEGGNNGAIAFADIDGDNDQDLIITGINDSSIRISKLYINNGNGNFTEMQDTSFERVSESALAFADVDGDSDLDLMMTGMTDNNRISKLYLNDGQGNFTEMENTPFEGVSEGAVAFNDIDGDGDQDVLITGEKMLNADFISKLYLNDGQGNFIEMQNTPFEDLTKGSIAFVDVDGDNDADIMITGDRGILDNYTSKLFFNDGTGNFNQAGIPIDPLSNASVAFVDVNGDTYQDLFITGSVINNSTSKLFINDQKHNFVEKLDAPFENIGSGAVAHADVDGDNDQDILISGSSSNGFITKLYNNDGQGNFTESTNNTFQGFFNASIVFVDVDGDNDSDIVIAGEGNFLFEADSKLYTNDGQGNFTEKPNTSFGRLRYGAIACSDIDGDGDQDLLVTGKDNSNLSESYLYINDGQGNFTPIFENELIGISNSAIAFADVDGDGDEDLLLTGSNFDGDFSILYLNDGQGNFEEVLNTPFDDIDHGAVAFADVDGDNDQDLLITGRNNTSSKYSRLFLNDGQANFTERTIPTLEGIDNSVVAFADIDEDNDPDLLVIGELSSFGTILKLFLNKSLSSPPTSTTEIPFIQALKVLPNPFQHSATFKIESIPGGRGILNIFDSNGVRIFNTEVLSETDLTFSNAHLPAGIYYYEVISHIGIRVYGGKMIKY